MGVVLFKTPYQISRTTKSWRLGAINQWQEGKWEHWEPHLNLYILKAGPNKEFITSFFITIEVMNSWWYTNSGDVSEHTAHFNRNSNTTQKMNSAIGTRYININENLMGNFFNNSGAVSSRVHPHTSGDIATCIYFWRHSYLYILPTLPEWHDDS